LRGPHGVVELRQLLLVDADRLLEEEREVPLQDLDRVRRVVKAIRADQDAVESGLVEHAIHVVIEGDTLDDLGMPRADALLRRIDRRDELRAGRELVDLLQHPADALAQSDDPEPLHVVIPCRRPYRRSSAAFKGTQPPCRASVNTSRMT